MELNALTSSTLPKLAWVADVDCQEEAVVLFHGSSVEVCANFFIEGVWNGPFQFGEFGNSDCVFGTGGVLDSNSICFVPSASTVDSLYYDEEGTHIIVSNSSHFCWAMSETVWTFGVRNIQRSAIRSCWGSITIDATSRPGKERSSASSIAISKSVVKV